MNAQSIPVLTKKSDLEAVCAEFARADFVTIDTEFMRETTYWPKLCLIQIASPQDAVLIDPLAGGQHAMRDFLAPFFRLMADESVTKVFHAGRQDIEIIYHLAGLIPHPVFDTQVAAMVCGFGEAVSYVALANKLCGKKLDKSSRFTDWSRRPLSDKQLTYALGDVTHLRDIYRKLKQQIENSGRASWVCEEMADLTAPEKYQLHPEQAWRRLKMRVKTPKALAIMIELAQWRECEAQAQDVPRARVLKDDAIFDIANQAPRTSDELGRLRTLNNGFVRSARGRDVLEAVARGLARDLDELPPLTKGRPMPASAVAVGDLLRVLLKAVSARHGVATKLIATADDLDKIALDDYADVPALYGWRRELFGEQALALKAGHLALAVENGAIVELPGPARTDPVITDDQATAAGSLS